VEDDTAFEDGDVDHVGADGRLGVVPMQTLLGVGRVHLGLVPLDDTVAGILNTERQENAGHQDGSRSGLVRQFSKTLVLEHQNSMGEQLDVVSMSSPRSLRREHVRE